MPQDQALNNGQYSVEHLHHFNCTSCSKWWSIGDASIDGVVECRQWWCPWCGHKQDVVPKQGMPPVEKAPVLPGAKLDDGKCPVCRVGEASKTNNFGWCVECVTEYAESSGG